MNVRSISSHPIPSYSVTLLHSIYSHVNLKYLPSGYAAVFVPLMNTWSLARTSASVSWKREGRGRLRNVRSIYICHQIAYANNSGSEDKNNNFAPEWARDDTKDDPNCRSIRLQLTDRLQTLASTVREFNQINIRASYHIFHRLHHLVCVHALMHVEAHLEEVHRLFYLDRDIKDGTRRGSVGRADMRYAEQQLSNRKSILFTRIQVMWDR